MKMEEMNNIIHLTDAEGNDCQFEFLDLIEHDGKEYVVLLPVGEDEVVILEVEEDDDSKDKSYAGVENESVLEIVFGRFKERFKDEFNFID